MIANLSMMVKKMKIKKIGEIWATDSTIKKHLSDLVVENTSDVFLDDYSCVIKKSSGIKYNVFGYNRLAYEELIFRIKH